MNDLKPVYGAATAEPGMMEPDRVDEKLGKKYPFVKKTLKRELAKPECLLAVP